MPVDFPSNWEMTKTAMKPSMFYPAFPRILDPSRFVSHTCCGADRNSRMGSDHVYTAALCLPGHVLVKLWLSVCYAGDVSSRNTHTYCTHHGHTLQKQSDPFPPTLQTFAVWCTPECQLLSPSLGLWWKKKNPRLPILIAPRVKSV